MSERRHLLWITGDLPCRGVSAAQERWWNLLARLAPRHELTLLSFVNADDPRGDDLPPGLAAVHRIPRQPPAPDDPLALLPHVVRYYYAHPSYDATLARVLAASRFDVVQFEYQETTVLSPPLALPTVLTVHQIGFAGEAPRWRAEGRGIGAGALALYRHLRWLDWELRALGHADHVLTMSPEDAARLRRFVPDLSVSVSPVGIDCATFRPRIPLPLIECDAVFVGNFNHPPNVDGIRWFAAEVLPLIGQRTHVRVAGRCLEPELRTFLAERGIEVLGPVDDVRPLLASARTVIAPVRFGTGMRGKVLEALGMARPVVTTSIGAEGLGAIDGEEVLVADDAPAFAGAVRRVLDDPGLAARLAAGGRALVEKRFDWDRIAADHDAVYAQVLQAHGNRPRLPRDRSGILARVARRVPAPANGLLGAALLALRGRRWYLHRRP